MHDAYIIESRNQVFQGIVQSIEGFGDKVIIGTKTGLLLMYENYFSTEKLDSRRHFETVDKKPICQMKMVPKEHLLFVLTNSMIYVFSIYRAFKCIYCCEETKGCSIFATDVKTSQNAIGQTDTRISLCVCNKRVLNFFVWKRRKLEPLDKQIKLKDEPKALSFMDNIIFVGFKDEYVAYNLASENQKEHELIVTTASKRESRCICLVKNSIFGIIKDDILIFIDPNSFKKHGELLEKLNKPIKWVSSVSGLVWDEPYIVGRTANGLEIHVLEEYGPTKSTLVQAMPDLKDVRFLVRSDNGDILAASLTEFWHIQKVNVSLQRKILLAQKNFKLAIELTNLGNEESKLETVREIRNSYARDLFMNKNFTAAFHEFLEADANPCEVIQLFRNSQNGESPSQPNIFVLMDKDLEDATLALTDYLIAARQKDIFSKFLSIMDTTLLKCYLKTNDSLVAPLLRRKKCDFLESERILMKHEKLNELIILYQVFEQHEKALTLLKLQASIEGSILFGHERTVKYLQDLDKDHKHLVFEYSQWVLAKNPDDGLKIFTDTNCERENDSIPKMEVLVFLSKTNRNLVLPYLEHSVYALNDPSPFIHEELITTYVEQIKKLNEKSNLSHIELNELELYRWKLIEILEKSDKYSPERILQIFPSENFFNERLKVLERMHDHEKILFIYIQILGNVGNALEYCEKVQNNDIFEILLQILRKPLKTSPYKGVQLHRDFLEPNFDIIIEVLNKYPTKMDPAKVFSLLPGDIPLYRIKNYMEIVTRMNMKKKGHYAILKETLKAENRRLNREILLHETKRFTVKESSICKECGKHFSNEQVLVRNANGDVLHLACLSRC